MELIFSFNKGRAECAHWPNIRILTITDCVCDYRDSRQSKNAALYDSFWSMDTHNLEHWHRGIQEHNLAKFFPFDLSEWLKGKAPLCGFINNLYMPIQIKNFQLFGCIWLLCVSISLHVIQDPTKLGHKQKKPEKSLAVLNSNLLPLL